LISQSISLHLFAQPQSPPHQFIWEHNSTNCDVDPHTRVEAAHFEDSWGNCAECSRIFTGVLAYGQWVAGTGDHRRGRFVQYAYAHEHACTPTQFPTMKLHCTTRPFAFDSMLRRPQQHCRLLLCLFPKMSRKGLLALGLLALLRACLGAHISHTSLRVCEDLLTWSCWSWCSNGMHTLCRRRFEVLP